MPCLMQNSLTSVNVYYIATRWPDKEIVTDETQGVLVSVQDSGPGIDPKSLDHLFDAFYTTKPQGLGMGLAISRSARW